MTSDNRTISFFQVGGADYTGWNIKSKPDLFAFKLLITPYSRLRKQYYFVYIHVITSFMYCFVILNILWHTLTLIEISQHRLPAVCIILPMTKHDIIEYLIDGIFNNSLKYCMLVWHSNPTTTNFIGTFWYNFLRNHTRAYFVGPPCLYAQTNPPVQQSTKPTDDGAVLVAGIAGGVRLEDDGSGTCWSPSFDGRVQRRPAAAVRPCPVVVQLDLDGTRVGVRARPQPAGRRRRAAPVRDVHVGNVRIVVGHWITSLWQHRKYDHSDNSSILYTFL